jgi:uncharacterized protein (DUF1501 family)
MIEERIMLHPTRRGFIIGMAATATAVAAWRDSHAVTAGDQDVLVLVFLRGGMDGLNLLPPVAGTDRTYYQVARPTLRIPVSGAEAALTLDGNFGLHPAAAPLLPLFEDGRLAIVHATGMHDPTRSHFEAQDFMELGTPGRKTTGEGWLHRHLASAPGMPSEITVPALSAGFMQPTSLLGNLQTLTVDDTEYFTFSTGPASWQDSQRSALRQLYEAGSSRVHVAGLQTMNGVDIVETYGGGEYTPEGGAVYNDDPFGNRMQLVARMLKIDLGIRVVTVDVGGWDTHEGQGEGSGGFFATLVGGLSAALDAFYTDMAASGYGDRFTLVTMTEFGRRIDENGDAGTDHGHAAPMLLLGDNVIGGLHGVWPGLEPASRFEGIDLEVTTDYRRVLSEVLIRRLGNPNLATVFPGYQGYEPLGVVQGEDAPPHQNRRYRRGGDRTGG